MGVTDQILALAQAAQKAKKAPAPAAPPPKPVAKAKPKTVKEAVAAMAPALPPQPTNSPDEAGMPNVGLDINTAGLTQQGLSKEAIDSIESVSKQSEKLGTVGKTITQSMLDPRDYMTVRALATEYPFPGLKANREANEALKAKTDEIERTFKPEIDMRPLAAGLDNLFGTDFVKSTPAPEKLIDRQKLVASLRDKLADDYSTQTKLEDSLINAMKLPQGGYLQNTTGQDRGTQFTQGSKDTAKTTAETPKPIRMGGSGKGQKMLDLKKVTSEAAFKRLQAVQQVQNAVRNYQRLAKAYGYEAVGANATALDSARQAAITAAKELDKLGSLQAGEKALVEEQIPNMTGIRGGISYLLNGRGDGVDAQFNNLLGRMERETAENRTSLYNTFPQDQYPGDFHRIQNLVEGASKGARTGGTTGPDTEVVQLNKGNPTPQKPGSLRDEIKRRLGK